MAGHSDDYYMARATALAQVALGRTSPNPAVGCVIVAGDEVVGEGYHPGAGQPHAEVLALAAAGADAHGATVYVTLEPCSTHGKTPPCTDALVSAGVSAVVYGTVDPNPTHQGRGIERLAAAGIECRRAGDERLLRSLNRGFFSWMERARPYVSAKVVTTLDGAVTLQRGAGTHLCGQEADAWVHRWRAASDAVMVGVQTAVTDDPLLTARPPEGCPRQPSRVVLDSTGRLPETSQLVSTAGRVPLLVVTTASSSTAWSAALERAGAEVIMVPAAGRHVDLAAALCCIGDRGMFDLAVEPGPRLLASLVESGFIDRLHLVLTPWVAGDRAAPRWHDLLASMPATVSGRPTSSDGEEGPARWRVEDVQRLGADVVLTLDPTGST